MIDLHIHSSFSDGKNTPTEIIELSRKLGIKTISITDHYSLDAYDDLKSVSDDIRLIPGIELGEGDIDPYHILGYNINIHDEKLIGALEKHKKYQMMFFVKLLTKLKKNGIDFYSELGSAKMEGRTVDVGMVFQILVDRGYYDNKDKAFHQLIELDNHGLATDNCFSLQEKIQIIKKAGGLAIFAHPLKTLKNVEQLHDLISSLKKTGLDGIEVYHPNHSEENVETLRNMSEEFNLLITGGSDAHSINSKNDKIGYYKKMLIPEEQILLNSYQNIGVNN
jgi:predicted metal-dependent phosphoesterase TrpH